MTTLQEANAEYIDHDHRPAGDWRDQAKQERPDGEVLLSRFFIPGNRCGLTWDDLTTTWRPFLQTGPRERRYWSKQRVAKALDGLAVVGAIEFTEGALGSRWQLTLEMRIGLQV